MGDLGLVLSTLRGLSQNGEKTCASLVGAAKRNKGNGGGDEDPPHLQLRWLRNFFWNLCSVAAKSSPNHRLPDGAPDLCRSIAGEPAEEESARHLCRPAPRLVEWAAETYKDLLNELVGWNWLDGFYWA